MRQTLYHGALQLALIAAARATPGTSINKRAPVFTSNIALPDGSYCFYCRPSNVEDSAECGVAAAARLQCFDDESIRGKCSPGSLSNINFDSFDVSGSNARLCLNAGNCLNVCEVANINTMAVQFTFCCLKDGSPYKDAFYKGTLDLKSPFTLPEVTITGTMPPLPTQTISAADRGIPCELVQNAVSSYQIAQEEGGATLGYWGAVMNMACLGADPSCNIAACRRVDKERKDDECDIDDIGGFQASIFQSLVGNPDFTKIAADAKRYQIKARQFESEMIDNLKKGEDGPGGHTPADYEQIIVNAALGAYDSNFYGTTELGLDVLVHQMGPLYEKYINDMVGAATSVDDLKGDVAILKEENDFLFNCQVAGAINVQRDMKEGYSTLYGGIAKMTASFVGHRMLNYYLRSAIVSRFGVKDYVLNFRRQTPTNSSISADAFKTAYDALSAIGFVPPKAAHFQDRINNWQHPHKSAESAHPSGNPAEFSTAAGSKYNITRALGKTVVSLAVKNRPAELNDTMAFVALLPLPEKNQSFLLFPNDNPCLVVGPVVAIYPNQAQAFPNPIFERADKDETAEPSTTGERIKLPAPQPPAADDKNLIYDAATITLTLDPSSWSNASTVPAGFDPSRDLALVDLPSRKTIPGSLFVAENGKLTLMAELSPGHGIWASGWNGGSVLGVGVLDKEGKVVLRRDGNSAPPEYKGAATRTSADGALFTAMVAILLGLVLY